MKHLLLETRETGSLERILRVLREKGCGLRVSGEDGGIVFHAGPCRNGIIYVTLHWDRGLLLLDLIGLDKYDDILEALAGAIGKTRIGIHLLERLA